MVNSQTMRKTMERMEELDKIQNHDEKQFDVGCDFLLKWYVL